MAETKTMPTLDDLRDVIPKHCMEISLARSTYYFLRDYSAIIFLYLIVGHVECNFGIYGLFLWLVICDIFDNQ